jgi:hypothetical protein
MPDDVVIIIPSQGADLNAFEDTAKKLKKEVYHHAKIVKTTVAASGGTISVSFTTLDGHGFSFDKAHHLKRVLTISHAGVDGPNLALGATDPPIEAHQPWGRDSSGELTPDAHDFWDTVGGSLRGDGKIILLGCHMGQESYASNVARTTGKHAFAATQSIAAGEWQTTLKYVKSIEAHHAKKPMKDFAPERGTGR